MSEKIKYYPTRTEAEKHRKLNEILYYKKPCKGGYYFKKLEKRVASKELLKGLFG